MQSYVSLLLVLTVAGAAVYAAEKQSKAISACVDIATSCDGWAEMGDCEKDKEFMHQYCRRSCNVCAKKACDDKYMRCAYWGKSGECKKNTWMNENCAFSCGKCKGGVKPPKEL